MSVPRALPPVLSLVLLLPALQVGCLPGPVESFERSFTSTVTVGRASRLVVSTRMPLEVVGVRGRDDLLAAIDVTVTASTASVAQRIAEALDLSVETTGADLELSLPTPEGSRVNGTIKLTVPRDLVLDATVNVGTAVVSNMSSALTVRSLGSARVTDASDDLTLIVTSGNAFASATPVPGKAVDIEVGTGNIELWLPAAVSADVAADVVQRGQVTVVHSVLPRAVGPGRTRYRAKVNGGLSPVRLLTRTGQVLIQQPQ